MKPASSRPAAMSGNGIAVPPPVSHRSARPPTVTARNTRPPAGHSESGSRRTGRVRLIASSASANGQAILA
jgi:hypothetical protein